MEFHDIEAEYLRPASTVVRPQDRDHVFYMYFCVDKSIFDQWWEVGHSEGLRTDVDIATFLLHLYVNTKKGFQSPGSCSRCHSSLKVYCTRCQSPPTPKSATCGTSNDIQHAPLALTTITTAACANQSPPVPTGLVYVGGSDHKDVASANIFPLDTSDLQDGRSELAVEIADFSENDVNEAEISADLSDTYHTRKMSRNSLTGAISTDSGRGKISQSSGSVKTKKKRKRNSSSNPQSEVESQLSVATRVADGTRQPTRLPESDEKVYKCTMCDKCYPRYKQLYWHLQKHKHKLLPKIYACDQCDYSCAHQHRLTLHMKSHSAIKPFTCKVCGLALKSKHTLERHERTHTGEKPFVCMLCSAAFADKQSLRYHMNGHMGKGPIRRRKCPDCGEAFVNAYHLKSHRQQHELEGKNATQEKKVSGVKARSAKRGSDLKEDSVWDAGDKSCTGVKSSADPALSAKSVDLFAPASLTSPHGKMLAGSAHVCEECGVGFENPTDLTAHLEQHAFKCQHCTATFRYTAALEVHVKEVHETKSYRCDYCDTTFLDKTGYVEHQFQRHGSGEGKFACGTCGKGFATNKSYKKHLLSHTTLRPYICDQCSASFKTTTQLKIHKIRHSGLKPFKCDQCEKSYTSKSALQEHYRQHTGERPFMCQECSAAFSSRGCLRDHMLIHTDARPFPCEICQKTFKSPHSLNLHLRIHRVDKNFVCEICNYSYKSSLSLKLHLERFHNITEDMRDFNTADLEDARYKVA